MTLETKPYRVLARKYRPRNFGELIGQEALVRTLTNAIAQGRIHHAYMLTGIRGTGKTTTARLIARALNYTGADGKAGPTTGPTDDCAICQAIAEGRQPDVLEMDAASNTGVDDVREIIDGVRYAPVAARYKIYIIDEVHMLSKNAFNALLKTLEEPPPRVIFIFATTEIRKVPVTVLSRCQRFDLRRVDAQTLAAYYGTICDKEKVTAEPEALQLLGRAADGSVRDGLSLLDQAIALGGDHVTTVQVHGMLGLSDRGQVLDLLESTLGGDCPKALGIMAELYKAGGDPGVLIQDLLDQVHILTRLKVAPDSMETADLLERDAAARATALAGRYGLAGLGRAWQILLKGLAEVNEAPNSQGAAEMVVIRLAYAAGLPDPADLLKKLKSGEGVTTGGGAAARAEPQPQAPVALRAIAGGGAIAAAPQSLPAIEASPVRALETLDDIELLLRENRDMMLAGEVYQYVHLVRLEPGRLDIRPEPQARPALAADLGKALSRLTGERWTVSIAREAGAPTLSEVAAAHIQGLKDTARAHPIVAEAMRLWPDAEISVREDKDI